MSRSWSISSLISLTIVAISTAAIAQTPPEAPTPSPATLPAAPGPSDVLDAPSADTPLADRVTSQAAGISLCPPVGLKRLDRAGAESAMEYVSADKTVLFRVTRQVPTKPLPLTSPPDTVERGMLDITVDQLKLKLPNNKVLRQDVVPLAGHDAGMVILRGTSGVHHQFVQQAVIRANDQLYYTVAYTVPGQSPSTPIDQPNATETQAVRTFQALLQSVQLLDQEKLRLDQEDRLIRTRTLMVNWTEARLRATLIPEQWLRVLRNGRDIGYSYIVESPEMRGNVPGLRVGIRSRTMPGNDLQIDAETWYHVAFDRSIENWSTVAQFVTPREKYYASEFGTSSRRRKPVADPNALADGPNRGIRLIDVYSLSVHTVEKKVTAPEVERDLPPFYLPQALGHLLPRLLPTNEPRTYLFYGYVSTDREVKSRYIDVGARTEMVLNGKRVQAVPITDRIGLDGAATVHYIGLDGKYLGSQTTVTDDTGKSSTVAVFPTDAATLQGLWKNIDLTAPATDPYVPGPLDEKIPK